MSHDINHASRSLRSYALLTPTAAGKHLAGTIPQPGSPVPDESQALRMIRHTRTPNPIFLN